MTIRTFMTAAASLLLTAGLAAAADKPALMHCFAFTPIEGASAADWDAYAAATKAWPSKMPAVKQVWLGKLRADLAQFSVDADARKKLTAGEKNVPAAQTNRVVRKNGACMLFEGGADVLKAYASHPYHAEWMKAYEKVRVAGTTTYDIITE